MLAPAADYAANGFVVTEIVSDDWKGAEKSFQEFPNAAKTYLQDGKAPRFGQVFRNPDLAQTLEILMRDGAEAYYEGEIAERIARYSRERGGYLTLKDLKEHRADWVEPVSTSYRGYDIWEIPPNGQGISALQMLNMLENFDIPSLQPNSAEHLHLFLEAKKLAFEDRSIYYADMEHAEVPVAKLIDREYGKERAKRINPKQAALDIQPGSLDGSSDTTYLCAADQDGNMISLIQSIYYGWGSMEVPTGLGFCMQNRGRAYHLNPEHRNTLEPHKRPFHTIIPGFMTRDAQPLLAFGVMGGDFQPQGHVQILMNIIDFGMSPQQAGEQPRVEHNGSSQPWGGKIENGGTISLEAGIDHEVMQKLVEMGHKIDTYGTGRFGGYQAIWRENEPRRYLAGSEPRKDGCALGY